MAKIVNSQYISEKVFKVYDFDGGWLDKIGCPEHGFTGLYYGPPKSGKSIEILKLCTYFADKFGKVLYNSCEEKLSKTLQDSINAFDIKSRKLYFGEGLDYEEMCEATKNNKYKLVVIDSVQYMKFTKDQYKDFIKRFPRVSLIIISQVNAKLEPFGGKGFVHMVDFYASINAGEAEYKSRYIKNGSYRCTLFGNKKRNKTLFDQ